MLPYGVQKRIELGRALAMEPKLLLLDEPVAGMNLEETEDMARYILQVSAELGLSMILVEHDMHLVMDIADRVLALDFGRPIAGGRPEEVQKDRTRDRGLPGATGMSTAVEVPAVPTADAAATLPAMLLRHADSRANDAALRVKRLGRWEEFSWADYERRAAQRGTRAARARRRDRRQGCGTGATTGPNGSSPTSVPRVSVGSRSACTRRVRKRRSVTSSPTRSPRS